MKAMTNEEWRVSDVAFEKYMYSKPNYIFELLFNKILISKLIALSHKIYG
jgi:hypothetical protein